MQGKRGSGRIADSKKAPPAPFLHWWVVQDDSASLALRAVAAGGSVVSLRSTRTCSRCIRLILRLTLRANAVALFKIVPDNFVESYISQIAKRRRQRHFYIGGSCRMTRLRLALRVVAAGGSVVSLRSTRTCSRFESCILQIAKKRL